MKILKEKKKYHLRDILKILDVMFFSSIIFNLVSVFGFCYEGKPYF